MVRDVIEDGNICSSGKDSISNSAPESSKPLSEGSVRKPHALLIMLAISLSVLPISIVFNLEDKPSSGNDSISGQYRIDKCSRDGKREHICSGNDFKVMQCQSVSEVKLVADNSSSISKDVKLVQW